MGLMEEAVSLSGSNMLTSHLVSLDLALALRDAGYPQQATFFRWIRPEGPQLTPVQKFAEQDGFILTDTNYSFPEEWEHYSAPLASELGEVLPSELADEHEDLPYYLKAEKADTFWSVYFEEDDRGVLFSPIEGDTEANARAAMWLHLRKASLI